MVPDILPVERISEFTLDEIEKKRVAALKADEVKNKELLKIRSKEELADISNFNYDTAIENERKDFMTRFKVIRKRVVEFAKPVAVIFNPAAGHARDVRE